MTKVLVLSGANHGFAESAALIGAFLGDDPGIEVTLTDDKEVFASPSLADHDVCVVGTGFTRSERNDDGSVTYHSELSADQENGLFQFVCRRQGPGRHPRHRLVDRRTGGQPDWRARQLASSRPDIHRQR